MAFYLETSAFLKLVVDEEHSSAMRAWFQSGHDSWSSELLVTESMRAARRLGVEAELVEQALQTVSLVLPAAATFRRAGELDPSMLRSLDALHLAAALEMGPELEGVVTYDARVTQGSEAIGLDVVKPM